MNTIYLVHPISGLSADVVFDYFKKTSEELSKLGYNILTAMYGKAHLRCEKEFRAADYKMPCTTNHAIFQRDRWMVGQADIIYANFMSSKEASIGSMMELAWASDTNKHIVVSMPIINPHRHAFVMEAASVVYETHEESIEYLRTLIKKEY